jgi:hypothetical protein
MVSARPRMVTVAEVFESDFSRSGSAVRPSSTRAASIAGSMRTRRSVSLAACAASRVMSWVSASRSTDIATSVAARSALCGPRAPGGQATCTVGSGTQSSRPSRASGQYYAAVLGLLVVAAQQGRLSDRGVWLLIARPCFGHVPFPLAELIRGELHISGRNPPYGRATTDRLLLKPTTTRTSCLTVQLEPGPEVGGRSTNPYCSLNLSRR